MNTSNRVLLIVLATLGVSMTAQAEEAVCVTAKKLTLRKSPNPKAEVTWIVGENMPLLRIAKKGSWSEVQDLEGEKHWAQSSGLSAKISCAVVKTKSAKLKKGPGSTKQSAEISVADQYTPFKKLEREGAWLLVQDEYKGQYWVNEINVWVPTVKSRVAF